MSPKTSIGKVVLIPYCLIGLPLTMLALKTSGELIALCIKTTAVNFEKKVLKRQNPEKKLIKCFVIISSILAVLVCGVAGLEVVFENWAFLDGVYCWFVTFTTIGFGDFVPFAQYREKHQNSDQWRVYVAGILFTIPFIIGLCLVSSLLNVLLQGSEKIKIHFHKICSCCGQQTGSVTEVNEENSKRDIRLQSFGVDQQKNCTANREMNEAS